MIKIHLNKVRATAILLLAIPVFIFFLFWLRPLIGVLASALLAVAVVLSLKSEDKVIEVKASTLVALGIIIALWVFLAGQGRFFTQSPDHLIRNAILRDMINYPWPVRYEGPGDESLVYYIGYWLVPSGVGKIVSLMAGFEAGYMASRITLFIWSFVFIYLTLILIAFRLNKSSLKNILTIAAVFIFFSGMDCIGTIARHNTNDHIESWAQLYVYNAMTTQLMDVFNQAVPAWLATSLAINEKDERAFALIGLLLLSTSPLPLFGLALYLVYVAGKNLITKKTNFKTIISPINVISVVVLLPIYWIYYDNNIAIESGITVSTSNHYVAASIITSVIIYIAFVLLEFGLLLLAIWDKNWNKNKKADCIFVGATLLVIPFLHVGWSTDFCMRASIPILFILMVMLMEYFTDRTGDLKDKKNRLKFDMVLAVFLLGAVTAMALFASTTKAFIESRGESAKTFDQLEGLADLPLADKGNCIGIDSSETNFYKYIGRIRST